ncbi:MAG: hypothetical protein QF489_00720 [Planctomycetota bacterium]|jgi:hypothetical protein|nr:hypothetical protein [Planctomycetota bacterium]
MRTPLALVATALLSGTAFAQTVNSELVFYQGDSTLNDWGLYRHLDRNSDGLFMAADELIPFAVDGATQITYVDDVKYRQEGTNHYVYIIASGDVVLRLQDLDGDGECAGPGEITQWADTRAGAGVSNTSPDSLDFDPITGTFYVTDDNWNSGSQPGSGIHAYTDLNGDGDANDAGEFMQFVDATSALTVPGTSGPVSIDIGDFEAVMYDSTNGIVIGFAQQDLALYAFQDLNGDGDAMDAGEAWNFCNMTFDVAGLEVNADVVSGALQSPSCPSSSGTGYYASLEVLDFAPGAGPSGEDVYWMMSTASNASCTGAGGLLYRGIDLNGDLDLNDIGEVTLMTGGPGSALTYPSMYGGAAHDGGFSCRAGGGDVLFYIDLNGDGDADDANETTLMGVDPLSHMVHEVDDAPVGAFAHPSSNVNWIEFGTGGTSSLGLVPEIDHIGFPTAGASFTVSLTNGIPNNANVLLAGFSNTVWNMPPVLNLPFDMTAAGAPGNTLYVAGEYQFNTVADASGNASTLLTIPGIPSLVGQDLFFQWYCLDSLANPRGATMSNAAQSTIE